MQGHGCPQGLGAQRLAVTAVSDVTPQFLCRSGLHLTHFPSEQ